ncbi:MAG: aspartate carbamoyltransferase regulatory subunit [Neisseriaceae bacterium]|nr:aspartate carbamoyltransferase regulatory subunit [Neisseriaceae bacterium]
MEKLTMTVEAIKNGTVIDHIPAGQGLNILRHFRLDEAGNRITVGFNLSGSKNKRKDLIKIEDVLFNDEEASRIALFAPEVTVNVIENFKVVKKINPQLPTTIQGIFKCPNNNCASHGEPVEGTFFVKNNDGTTRLKCFYCEKSYPMDWVMSYRN